MQCHPLFALAVLTLTACGSDSPPATPTGPGGVPLDERGCFADVEPGTVVELAEDFPGGTEGLAFSPDGRLFVSTAEAVHEVAPDGTVTTLAELDSALGLAWDDGALMVAAIGTGHLLRLALDGTTEVVAGGLGQPNFVTPTPWNTWLVSDDFTTKIWEVTPAGAATVWYDEIASPNGMVFDADGSTLYAASTFTAPSLWAVAVDAREPFGRPTQLAPFTEGEAPDGIALDAAGNVYVALNLSHRIARVTPDGERTIVATDVANPASMAFGRGDFDPCSLYVSSLFQRKVHRVAIGEPGP